MASQFNRTAVIASLSLSLTLVVGVLFGAKYFLTHVARQPVSVSELPSPLAASPECTQLIESLPAELMGDPRADIAQPRPAGVAAWATYSTEATVLRCGVDMPMQYTTYSATEEVAGVSWLPVRDMTPGSSLTTWYTTDFTPAVAVTTFSDKEPSKLADALSVLPHNPPAPRPAPLSQLNQAANASECQSLLAHLPDNLGEDYERKDVEETFTAAWSARGREPIVVRCGVTPPQGYEPGVTLQQVNDIPWFEDTTLGEGTTAGTWYALGFVTDIAVSAPQVAANTALVQIGTRIHEHLAPATNECAGAQCQ
ncbi:MAG: DUF3515 domain-containing protein [Corynebacterium sp.]|nr:DUF3515 domain-containing protein [Corynebacterium sp.]